MSYRTQEDLRSSRLQAHFQRIFLKESRDLVTQLQWEKNNFRLKMLRQKRTIARLHKKVSDQDKLIENLERQATELEEEGKDLRRENNAFISDDDDFLEEMDCEEVDENEDMIDEEESHKALLDDKEEEDPKEPEYMSDTDAVVPQVPPQ